MMRPVFCVLLAVMACSACRKPEETVQSTDPRLTRPYCNDPLAVNYNRDFPGRPDNSVCFYPYSLFTGRYVYYDSVYGPDNVLDTSRRDSLAFTIYRLDNERIALVGLCGGSDSLLLTANRLYAAVLDTPRGRGQRFCTPPDTVTGALSRPFTDTMGILKLDFTVSGDTARGLRHYMGTAFKRQ